ncbi:MAG TPA: hypothetical protein VGX95_03505 [Xanthobacteraceae bacterium]|jgi:hypothetical protein|nr:hypothetical protein [Xanthobacteraceae bacterium]
MKLKLVIAVAALAALPFLVQAQQKGGPPPAAKPPTKAEVQKVVNQIKGDKPKLDAYCQIVKLSDQAQALDEKKDEKKIDDIYKQVDALSQKLGPDYAKLMAGMEEIDPESKDGKDLIAIFDSLVAACPK